VIAFAALLERLIFSPARNTKLRLMEEYFRTAPDPDRGYALAALTDGLDFPHAKASAIRALVETRVDPVLLAWSYDFVGDLAETAALIWPAPAPAEVGVPRPPPRLSEVVEDLRAAGKDDVPALMAQWLDALDATGRWALLKLIGGGMRVGASARLAKAAVASIGGQDVARIEELWHGLSAPYTGLFAWLSGQGPEPALDQRCAFRPMMLAHAIEAEELTELVAPEFRAEWKWDGIRVQLVSLDGERKLFSRTGEDVGLAFPDILLADPGTCVIDGELLVRGADDVGSFNDLQQRLNRKKPSPALVAQHPAFVRVYDILFDGQEDLRALPFDDRRRRLEAWHARHRGGAAFDLSPTIAFATWDELKHIAASERPRAAEGVMLKRADSPYLAGRPKGYWFKWKREARTVDAVLMYAQRGHGRRSSYYSDFTFGCWRTGPEGRALVPVGKAYFGFSDAELMRLDRFVRGHTTNRFGPVREVEPTLVCELAFDSVNRSTRHKSGVALRFPRIARIRWDKPAIEADELAALEKLIEG
jgi:DNA ligase-1